MSIHFKDITRLNVNLIQRHNKTQCQSSSKTLEALRDVTRGAPLSLHAWRRMKSRLILGNESAIYLKASPNLHVLYVEK